MIQKPQLFGIPDAGTGTRLALASVAMWWVVFSIPLFRSVPEPPVRMEPDERAGTNALIGGARRLMETFTELRRYRDAFVFLLAFLLYNDGIQTMIRMATIYGTGIGLPESAMIAALLLTQFIGVPCAFLFGMAASRTGALTGVFVGLGVYVLITVLGYFMRTAAHFYALAILVGMVQGGTQALSRSLFASMIPRHKSSEFFGFFSVFEKFAGIAGPALFAVSVSLFQSSRAAVLSVIFFFVAGGILLTRVDVAAGEAEAAARD
jgi:MFS transporter, UMF1 family